MHGSNRLGGNSLSDLLVFGKRAGEHAAAYTSALASKPAVGEADLAAALETALAPLNRGAAGENPYQVWHDLQTVMQDLVGIIRRKGELEDSIKQLGVLRGRVANVGATGGRKFNPGWHLALDLRNMLVVSECTARAALEREESRGGHTREDFPVMDPKWRLVNLVLADALGRRCRSASPAAADAGRNLGLFEQSELSKYMTPDELSASDAAATAAKSVTVNDDATTKIGGQ